MKYKKFYVLELHSPGDEDTYNSIGVFEDLELAKYVGDKELSESLAIHDWEQGKRFMAVIIPMWLNSPIGFDLKEPIYYRGSDKLDETGIEGGWKASR